MNYNNYPHSVQNGMPQPAQPAGQMPSRPIAYYGQQPPQMQPPNKKNGAIGNTNLTTGFLIVCIIFALVLSLGSGVGGAKLAKFLASAEPEATTEPEGEEDDLQPGIGAAIPPDADSWSAVAEKALQSSVAIYVQVNAYGNSYNDFQTEGIGSGTIITEDGYIITNDHVAGDAYLMKVELFDGTTYEAKLVKANPDIDIALIKIDATGLTPAPIGNSDSLHTGDRVIAIGCPLFVTFTVTEGLIGNTDVEIDVGGAANQPFYHIMHAVQISVPINPGNSGGGVFNVRGELVVVVNAGNEDYEHYSFGIPVNMAIDFVQSVFAELYPDTPEGMPDAA